MERPARLGWLEINYTPLDLVAVSPRSVGRYAAVGVDCLVVCPLSFDGSSVVVGFLCTPLDLVAVGPRSVGRYAALGVDRLMVYLLPFDGPSDVSGFLCTPLDSVAVGPRSVGRYAALGVDRLVAYPLPLDDPSDVAGFLERHAAPHCCTDSTRSVPRSSTAYGSPPACSTPVDSGVPGQLKLPVPA